MKKFDVALHIKIDAPNDWNRAKVRLFIDALFQDMESPLGSVKVEGLEVKPAYIDISEIGGKK